MITRTKRTNQHMTRNNHGTESTLDLSISRKQAIGFFTGVFIMGIAIFKYSLLTPYNFISVILATIGSFGMSITFLSKYDSFKGYYRTRYTLFAGVTLALGLVLVTMYGLPTEVMLLAVLLLAGISIIPFILYE